MPILREIDFWPADHEDLRRAFRLQTRCIAALFGRSLPKFKNEDCWKVMIQCVDGAPRSDMKTVGGVLEVQTKADVIGFLRKDDVSKKKQTLQLIMRACNRVAARRAWPVEPFKTAANAVKKANFKNTFVWKTVQSPNRHVTASVICEHDVQECRIILLIANKSGQLMQRHELLSTEPSEWAFARFLGDVKWASMKKVVLRHQKPPGGKIEVPISLDI